jgi:opacity protein-like surface antigen
MMMRRTLCALVLAGSLLTSSALAQADSWQHKWYWGAQAGLMEFKTPTSTSWQQAFTAGGSWFITGRRSALYVAYDQVIFRDTTSSAVLDASSATGFQTLAFTRGRRIQAHLYIVPLDGWVQPYLGGGFAINQITNAAPKDLTAIATNTELQTVLQTIDQTTTKAFPVFSGGLQLRFGDLALFGQYQFMPTGRNYLIDSAQHVFSVGMRYAVTGSREEVTTAR